MPAPKGKSYLVFEEIQDEKKITRTFLVKSKQGGHELGTVKWYAPWRRYVFYPTNNTLFDSACMSEVVSHIDSLMAERKLS